MTTQLDTTIKAFQNGLTELAIDKGIKNIEGWSKTLEQLEFRGAKIIHENLGKLKKQLEADAPDRSAIGELLQMLGDETKRAASQLDGAQGEKITLLGELLGKSSQDLSK